MDLQESAGAFPGIPLNTMKRRPKSARGRLDSRAIKERASLKSVVFAQPNNSDDSPATTTTSTASTTVMPLKLPSKERLTAQAAANTDSSSSSSALASSSPSISSLSSSSNGSNGGRLSSPSMSASKRRARGLPVPHAPATELPTLGALCHTVGPCHGMAVSDLDVIVRMADCTVAQKKEKDGQILYVMSRRDCIFYSVVDEELLVNFYTTGPTPEAFEVNVCKKAGLSVERSVALFQLGAMSKGSSTASIPADARGADQITRSDVNSLFKQLQMMSERINLLQETMGTRLFNLEILMRKDSVPKTPKSPRSPRGSNRK